MPNSENVISCGFFDANILEGSPDREYRANDMNMFLGLLTSDGILASDSNNYKVSIHETGSTFEVDVNIGSNGKPAISVIDKHWMILSSTMVFRLSNPSSNNRIDSIVIRCDSRSSVRTCSIELKEGVPSGNPVPPALTNEPGSIVEYRLANITVRAGASSLYSTDIEDTRGGSECGYIHGLIDAPDTRNLFDNYQEAFSNAIDGTIAGELQTRISNLENKFYYGTSDPNPTLGSDGDLYFKYES